MKKTLFVLLAIFGLFLSSLNVALAATVKLYVDAAPSSYFESSGYDSWWTTTKAAVVAGSFTNMRNGVNPANVGTTNFEVEDEVIYSFGDYGKELTWIYWVPNTTISALENNFKIRLETWWDGEYLDFYKQSKAQSWVKPENWEEYAGGVIGVESIAWWGALGMETPEALAADISARRQVDEIWKFTANLSTTTESITSSRSSAPVPEPTTILLLGCGLLGIAGTSRKRK